MMFNNMDRHLLGRLTAEPILSELRNAQSDDEATRIATAYFSESARSLHQLVVNIRGMSNQDVMKFRLVNRLIDKPEILDELRERLESDEIVEWDDNPTE